MIKSELVQRISAQNPHLYQRDVEKIINAILGEIIAATDLLAVVPGWFGQILAQHAGIRIWPLPFAISGYEVTLNWHERYTRDPGHQWLRTTVQRLFEARPSIVPPSVRTKGPSVSRKR